MRLILIRHGQTPSNVLNLLDTSVPGPELTALGQRQAQALPAALAGLADTQPSALYASTQTRAQQTAAPLAAALGLPVQVRDGLREIAAGDLEMKGDVPSVMAYLSTVRNWLLGDLEVRMPGGPTGTEVLQRFDAVIREAELSSDGGTVAMVSHGAMIRTWAGYRASNIDAAHPENYDLSNTGIVIMEGSFGKDAGQSGWRVLSWISQGGGAELADPETDGPTAELAEPTSTGPGPHAGN